jgi:phosphoglycolate phosphatase-like HAD superfamily hydrolase
MSLAVIFDIDGTLVDTNYQHRGYLSTTSLQDTVWKRDDNGGSNARGPDGSQ